MTTKYIVTQVASGTLIPLLLAFLGDTVVIMVPWFIAMFTTVIADLAAGLWKSYKLKVPIRASRAIRETMGKMVVYFAFVLMACCINEASKGDFNWAKWLSLVVITIEIGSMVSNFLKPHGINISMTAFIKAIITHSAIPFTCTEMDDMMIKEDVESIRKEELEKIEREEAWKEPKSSEK